MSVHPDPELLAAVALGDHPHQDLESHLASCPACAAELSSLRRLTAGEHVLSHGLPLPTPQQEESEADAEAHPAVEVLQGADGEELLEDARRSGLLEG